MSFLLKLFKRKSEGSFKKVNISSPKDEPKELKEEKENVDFGITEEEDCNFEITENEDEVIDIKCEFENKKEFVSIDQVELMKNQQKEIMDLSTTLNISIGSAGNLLRNYRWNKEK